MADSRWRVGGLTSSKTFGRTEQEVANILNLFIKDKISPRPEGLTDAQENQRRLDFAHDEVVRYIQREARRNRVRELQEQQSVEEQAESETTL